MSARVVVVTDSTACLPADLVTRHDIAVVPLRVTLGARTAIDGVDISAGEVARALRSGLPVSTSRPTPGQFAAQYRALLESGAQHIVSVHLSAALSGTWESAVLAAQEFDYGVVRVVDSRATGMALGYAVLDAAERAADGASAADVQGAASGVVDATRTLFYVDNLDYLRRGGRIGSAAALFATTLSVKPLLHLVEGQIVPLEKVRTSSRALARLRELTVQAADTHKVDLAVHHVDALDRARELAAQLQAEVAGVRECHVRELGPVLGAHLGPGALGTVIVRR